MKPLRHIPADDAPLAEWARPLSAKAKPRSRAWKRAGTSSNAEPADNLQCVQAAKKRSAGAKRRRAERLLREAAR